MSVSEMLYVLAGFAVALFIMAAFVRLFMALDAMRDRLTDIR